MSEELRPLERSDWRLLRELRLRALTADPDAFGPTVEAALDADDGYWRGWAAGRDGAARAWAAFVDGEPAALISCGVRGDRVGHFGALWVDPRFRRLGLARLLVETACAWLAKRGCDTIRLDMTEGNPAERLYRELGFERTGEEHQLREGSPLLEVTMERRGPVVD